jgi:iron complex outermembrane receptor protein
LPTSFETPTTTELVNQPNSTGGFNTDLIPQRAVTLELGERGRIGAFNYSIAGFLGRISDAIVQFSEVSGRGFFTNAGKVHNDGIEVGVDVTPVSTLRLFGSYTWSHYRFADYKIVNGTAVDTLDGKTLPGVPEAFIRLGLRAGPYKASIWTWTTAWRRRSSLTIRTPFTSTGGARLGQTLWMESDSV